MLSELQILRIEGDLIHPLNFLWSAVCAEYGLQVAEEDPTTFSDRVDDFLSLIRRFMDREHLKLAKNGNLLTGSHAEQISVLRGKFPSTDDSIDMGGAGAWFFTEECPAGAVWVVSSGTEEWLEWT